jgi:hypothetical protein
MPFEMRIFLTIMLLMFASWIAIVLLSGTKAGQAAETVAQHVTVGCCTTLFFLGLWTVWGAL